MIRVAISHIRSELDNLVNDWVLTVAPPGGGGDWIHHNNITP